MKTHLINRSLLILVLSSSALVAATGVQLVAPVQGTPAELPDQGTPAELPDQGVQAVTDPVAMPRPFTERDGGTPISIPMNRIFRVTFHTDSKVDPVGSFWRPVVGANQNFKLVLKDKTTNNYFNREGYEHQTVNVIFDFKPLVLGKTELSFELVQCVPAASGSDNANRSSSGDYNVIRTVTFNNVKVVPADNTSGSTQAPAHGGTESGVQTLKNNLSTTSW